MVKVESRESVNFQGLTPIFDLQLGNPESLKRKIKKQTP